MIQSGAGLIRPFGYKLGMEEANHRRECANRRKIAAAFDRPQIHDVKQPAPERARPNLRETPVRLGRGGHVDDRRHEQASVCQPLKTPFCSPSAIWLPFPPPP